MKHRGLISALFAVSAVAEAGEAERARLDEKLGRVEIPFVANVGLHDPAVAFSASTFEGAAFVTRKGQIVYSLSSGSQDFPGWTLTETPLKANAVAPVGEETSETCVSYFLGDDPALWRTNVDTYRTVSLGKAWPGVSLRLRAYGNSIEKLFTVEPGADASRIRMHLDGARSLRLDRDGSLLVATGLGEVRFTAPIAYQERRGVRHAVSVAYRVKGFRYGFVLGDYDPGVAVVIDPLLQATYLGGSGDTFNDEAHALAIHPTSGEVYVAGLTTSSNFPGTAGGAQPAISGLTDAFVARMNASLTSLVQATYLGGTGNEFTSGLAIHSASGEVYVTGHTFSTNFPGTAGGAQPASGGGNDSFVARLSASLTTLAQATYLGGSANDGANALAIHPSSGEVYVAGQTASTNFPGTAGGAQPAYGGGLLDAFVARLSASLTSLGQATYLGGSAFFGDVAQSLAIHPTSGEVYLAGSTYSTNFPGTAGGAQPVFAGGVDAFVVRLTATLTSLAQATYLGGSASDGANALAIHATSGEVYTAGSTNSTNFPGTAGGAQPVFAGAVDAFVAHLNASLTSLAQATYLGGGAGDQALALAIHPSSGEVYAAGITASTNFPGTAGGAQPASGGDNDAFVARLDGVGGGLPGLPIFIVTPCRVLDTRDPAGPVGGPALAAGATRDFIIVGLCNIPVNARGVFANVTVTAGTGPGHLSIFPAGTALPLVSTINFQAGQTRANNAILVLGANGGISVFDGQSAGNTVDFILDVIGYF